MLELTLFSIGLIFIIFALYNFELAKLYSCNEKFINNENKRRNLDFKNDNLSCSRRPVSLGNKYIENEQGELVVISQTRSSLITYI